MQGRAGCRSYSSKQGSEHLNRSRDWGSCKTCRPTLCRSDICSLSLHADTMHGQGIDRMLLCRILCRARTCRLSVILLQRDHG